VRHLWRLVVDIYEPDSQLEYPVLRHVFYGTTEAEAWGIFKAHMGTDRFLAGCVNKGRWDGVDCDFRSRWLAPGEVLGED
jgi:hypothetical protein